MDERRPPSELPKSDSKFVALFKRLDQYLGELFFGKFFKGKTSFSGDLSIKVKRERSTWFQRLRDKIRGHL
jgi:hypothetical protein